ncbi:MAG: hypothetical protein ACYSUC_13385 [Planctomycetota bacterium]|jgi:hypothetical protein
MRKRVLWILVSVGLALGFIVLLPTIPGFRRSPVGRIIRWCLGESGHAQEMNDLAEDAEKIGLAKLQAWSQEVMRRYTTNSLSTAGMNQWYRPERTLNLAEQEIPEFIRKRWDGQVSIHLSESGEPKCVVLGDTTGILVGPPNFVEPLWPHHHDLRQLIPGVYVYHDGRE